MTRMPRPHDTFKAVSNVIELKPGKKYLLVFQEGTMPYESADLLLRYLREEGITAIGIALAQDGKMEVIEVPQKMEGKE